MATEVVSSLAAFNNAKLYIHSQKDEFFRRGVSVRSNASADETKSEDGRTTRMDTTTHDVNPLELDADIAHFKVLTLLFVYTDDLGALFKYEVDVS